MITEIATPFIVCLSQQENTREDEREEGARVSKCLETLALDIITLIASH